MKKRTLLAMAGIVGNTDTDKFIRDHINKGHTPYREHIMTEEQMKRLKDHFDNKPPKGPIPICGKALIQGFDANGKEFTAKATNCTLSFEQPSEKQQKMIDESNKKMNEIMAPVNAALIEYVNQFKMYPNKIEIKLISDNDAASTNSIKFKINVERE